MSLDVRLKATSQHCNIPFKALYVPSVQVYNSLEYIEYINYTRQQDFRPQQHCRIYGDSIKTDQEPRQSSFGRTCPVGCRPCWHAPKGGE